MLRDGSHWTHRLAEFAEQNLWWLSTILVVAGVLFIPALLD